LALSSAFASRRSPRRRTRIAEAQEPRNTGQDGDADLSDAPLRAPTRDFRRATIAPPTTRNPAVLRPLILAGSLAAGLLALYSCSMQASVTTDDDGRIVELSSLRIESSLSRWAVEMLIVGGQLAIELRWTGPRSTETRTQTDCPAGDAPGALVASA
jgi:hypothetical protein